MARNPLSNEELGLLADEGNVQDLERLSKEELKRLEFVLESRQNPSAAAKKFRLESLPEGTFPTTEGEVTPSWTKEYIAERIKQYKGIPKAILENKLGERIFSGQIVREIAEGMGAGSFGQEGWRYSPTDEFQVKKEEVPVTEKILSKVKAAGSIAKALTVGQIQSVAEFIESPTKQITESPETALLNVMQLGALGKGIKYLSKAKNPILIEKEVENLKSLSAARSETKLLPPKQKMLPAPKAQLALPPGRAGEAGFVRTEPLVLMGKIGAGAALGYYIGSIIEDVGGKNRAGTGAVLGGLIAAGASKYAKSPEFKEAVDKILQIGKGRGKPEDFEALFQAIIEPMLPSKPINLTGGVPVAQFLPAAAGAATGAYIGAHTGVRPGEKSIGGAVVGGLGGLMMGAVAGKGIEPLLSGPINLRKSYRQIFTESRGLPPDVLAVKLAGKRRLYGRLGEIKDAFDVLKKANQAQANVIDEFIRGNAPLNEVPQQFRNSASQFRQIVDELGRDLVRTGIAQGKTAETIMTNLGTYVPRLYMYHELEDSLNKVWSWAKSRNIRLSDLDQLKMRKDLTPEIREALGEISSEFGKANPAYLLGKRAPITAADVEFASYAKYIASSPDYVLPEAMAADLTGAKTVFGGKTYRKLPDSKKLGVLRNKYVLDSIADDLETFITVPSALRQIFDAGTGMFKGFKIGANSSTLIRNVIGNTVNTDVIGGVSPIRLDWYKKSYTDFMKKSPRYLEARAAGAFGGEWFGEEVENLLRPVKGRNDVLGTIINNTIKLGSKLNEPGARFHRGTEQYFKMVNYNYARDALKMAPAEAAEWAQRIIFDYSEVPAWIQFIRRSPFGAPFISFSYKALPRIMGNALAVGTAADPFGKFWRFWKWPLALGASNEFSARNVGLIDEDEKQFVPTLKRIAKEALSTGVAIGESPGKFGEYKRVLADYIGNQQLLLPFRDAFGRLLMLDLTWTLPWGDIAEFGVGHIGKMLAKSGFSLFPRQLEPSNPWLQAVLSTWTNKDLMTNQDIVTPNALPAEAWAQRASYIMRLFGPTWFPGGFAFNKLQRAFSGEFTQDPNQPTIAQAMLSELGGTKVRPVEPILSFVSRYKELQKDLQVRKADLNKLVRSGATKEKILDAQTEFRKAIQDFRDKYGTGADYPAMSPKLVEARRKAARQRAAR